MGASLLYLSFLLHLPGRTDGDPIIPPLAVRTIGGTTTLHSHRIAQLDSYAVLTWYWKVEARIADPGPCSHE